MLTESEAAQLLKVMKGYRRARGIAIIFITHRLDEVINAADGITILRDGKLVAECRTKDTDVPAGRNDDRPQGRIRLRYRRSRARCAWMRRSRSKLSHLAVDMPGETVNDVSLEVREGEIFGIGGLAGQGKVGIPNGVMGIYPGTGEVEFWQTLPAEQRAAGAPKRHGHRVGGSARRGSAAG